MTSRIRAVAIVLAALVVAGCGFTGNLRGNPGFASFRTPSTMRDTEREFALSLGPIPIRLATMISRPVLKDEPWIPKTLREIKAVRVYMYEVDGKPVNVQRHLTRTTGELVAEGWERIVAVREDGGLVSALVMPGVADTVDGIVVMFHEDEELVLVNVIGNIRPETLGMAMEALDIDMPVISYGKS